MVRRTDNNDGLTLPQRLAMLREERGWSQADVADKLRGDKSYQPTISRWESDDAKRGRYPQPENLVELADLYGVRLRYLITGYLPRMPGREDELAMALDNIEAVLRRVREGEAAKSPSDTKAARVRRAKGKNGASGAKEGAG